MGRRTGPREGTRARHRLCAADIQREDAFRISGKGSLEDDLPEAGLTF